VCGRGEWARNTRCQIVTAGTDPPVSMRLQNPNFDDNYLGEYEGICETAFSCELGSKGGLIDCKKPSVENLVTLSQKYQFKNGIAL
jgi:hypothetical protein